MGVGEADPAVVGGPALALLALLSLLAASAAVSGLCLWRRRPKRSQPESDGSTGTALPPTCTGNIRAWSDDGPAGARGSRGTSPMPLGSSSHRMRTASNNSSVASSGSGISMDSAAQRGAASAIGTHADDLARVHRVHPPNAPAHAHAHTRGTFPPSGYLEIGAGGDGVHDGARSLGLDTNGPGAGAMLAPFDEFHGHASARLSFAPPAAQSGRDSHACVARVARASLTVSDFRIDDVRKVVANRSAPTNVGHGSLVGSYGLVL